MRVLILLLFFIVTGCSYNHIKGYNLHTYENNLFKEYFMHESTSLIKTQLTPSRSKLVFIGDKNDDYSELFISRLRNMGYSILEISTDELKLYSSKKDDTTFSYSVDYVYKKEKKTNFYYISLHLFLNNFTYSKMYLINSLGELPQPLGNWTVKGINEERK